LSERDGDQRLIGRKLPGGDFYGLSVCIKSTGIVVSSLADLTGHVPGERPGFRLIFLRQRDLWLKFLEPVIRDLPRTDSGRRLDSRGRGWRTGHIRRLGNG